LIRIMKHKSDEIHRTSRSSGYYYSCVQKILDLYPGANFWQLFGIFFNLSRNMPSNSFLIRYSPIILPLNTSAGWTLEAARPSETEVHFYQTARRHIPEYGNHHYPNCVTLQVYPLAVSNGIL
jgi:hypothetical protein